MPGALLKQQDSVSPFRGMPVDLINDAKQIISVTGETVQLYYYNSGVLTADAGQAAGVVVVAKLANSGVLNAISDVLGSYRDTSLTFTSTAFTTEVEFPWLAAEQGDGATGTGKAAAITSGFTNGQYCVDYRNGTLYGVKASTQTTLTSTAYKVSSALQSPAATAAAVGLVPQSTSAYAATGVDSTAYEAGHILKASAGNLYGIFAYNSKTSAQFIQLHNSATLPAEAAVPLVTFSVPPQSNFSLDMGILPKTFSAGIVVCNSSTGPTKTIGSADCWFSALIA